MAAPKIEFSARKLARARWKYECTGTPVGAIADYLMCSRWTLYQRIKELGWHRRQLRAPQLARWTPPDGAAAADEQAGLRAPSDPPAVAAELLETVARELSAVSQMVRSLQADERSAAAERAARTLASLARTFNEATRMRAAVSVEAPPAESPTHDDMPPADPDAFREALARRIEAFVQSRIDAGLCDDGGEHDA
jgi:hypothetical protein